MEKTYRTASKSGHRGGPPLYGGPDEAAMTANVITFRGRSAMREIGKALAFPPEVRNRFSRLFGSGDFPHTLALEAQVRQAGIPLDHPRTRASASMGCRVILGGTVAE